MCNERFNMTLFSTIKKQMLQIASESPYTSEKQNGVTMGVTSESVLDRLRSSLDELSPQLRRAGLYILEHPEEVAMLSMRQASEKAQVQPVTMLRLAQRLGFESYIPFQKLFRNRLRQASDPFSSLAQKIQSQTPVGLEDRLVSEILEHELATVSRAYSKENAEQLREAAATLLKARRVFIVGLRSYFPVAFYLHYCCRMFLDSARLLDGTGGTLGDDLRGAGPEDAVLAISYSPYTQDTVSTVRYCADRKAQIVTITDSPDAPIAQMAAHVLLSPDRNPAFFHSVTGAMTLAQSLVAVMVAQAGEAAVQALRECEEQLAEFHAYTETSGITTEASGVGA